MKERSSEFNKLKEDLLRSRRAVQVLTGADTQEHAKDAAKKDLVTPLEQRRQKYIKRKREHGDRSNETMDKLKMFASTLREGKGKISSLLVHKEPSEVESYHGQVLEKDESPDEDLTDWNSGKLKFKKHIDDKYRSGGDGRNAIDYEIFDPREMRDKDDNGSARVSSSGGRYDK